MEPPAKKPRGQWTLEQLEAAMAAVNGRQLSQRAAAARYSIPRRTLVNHLKSGKVEKQIGRRTILTADQENDLASRIKRLAAVGYPLTPKVIRHQAYVFCEQHNIPNTFSKTTKRAGKDWLKLFLKRHRDITKRKVQILNPGRAQKLNKNIVMQHFEEYKKIYEELDIRNHPEYLYNMDEKGCRLTLHKQPTVLAKTGSKRVHLVAPEHAENVTVAACVNAVGFSIPSMIIFKGKRMKPEFTDNLPAGSLVKMAAKGSMTSTLFVDFIHHLGKYKMGGKCLLVFDGASCHLDYKIVEAADEENIVLYCLPSNTTHELQPLDKSVNKSFEHYWDEETLSFLYEHPDKKLTKARFNSIFSRVWSKCMTHNNIVNGFRATGLYPFNPEAIPVEAFAPAVLTERSPQYENDFYGQGLPIPGPSGPNIRAVNSPNSKSSQKSPTPGSSGLTDQRPIESHGSYSADSDETFCEDQIPNSSSTQERNVILPQLSRNTKPVLNKKCLVEYSTTDTDSIKSNMQDEINRRNADIRRPILYSSDSDTSADAAIILSQMPRRGAILNVYSSTDDENDDPLLKQQERTPEKQVETSSFANVDTIRRRTVSCTTSDEDSEDNIIPLARLKSKKIFKSPFQQLIPTPNFGVVKDKPRRKAINYKARVVTKDLFTEREMLKKKKEELSQQQKKTCSGKKREVLNKARKSKANEREGKKQESIQRKELKRGKTKETTGKLSKGNKKRAAEDKWYCHACNEERFDDMRQCPICQRWFHEVCLGLTEEDIDFECLMCG